MKHARRGPGRSTVEYAVARLDPVTLEEVCRRAALEDRAVRKYFVPLDVIDRLFEELAPHHDVLEIASRRVFDYETHYFDDARLTTYRSHLQRRRQRYKIRTRTYLDTATCMLELKLAGARGRTLKVRTDHHLDDAAVLTVPGLSFLSATLSEHYAMDLPGGLERTLTTTYARTTLVARTGESRVTCDLDLICSRDGKAVHASGRHVLIETKSVQRAGPADLLLRRLGIRPVRMSKYCVGLAALDPDLTSNPWHPTLRTYFEPAEPGTRI